MDFRTNRRGNAYPRNKGSYHGGYHGGKPIRYSSYSKYSKNPEKVEQQRLIKERQKLLRDKRERERDIAIAETNKRIRKELFILSQLTQRKVSPRKVHQYRHGKQTYPSVNLITTLGRKN